MAAKIELQRSNLFHSKHISTLQVCDSALCANDIRSLQISIFVGVERDGCRLSTDS